MGSELSWVLCPECKRLTKHEVLKEYVREMGYYSNNEQDEEGYVDNSYVSEPYIYQIIECRGCENISYRQFIRSSHSNISEKLFPIRDISDVQMKDFGTRIPEKIKILYAEVISTFNNRLGVLCAAGIRAIIEGICNEKSIEGGKVIQYDSQTRQPATDENGNTKLRKSKNLDGKIEGLAEKGFITKRYASILHNPRFLGNQAVHQLDKPSEENLKLAIGIIEHTLESIYEIEVKAQKLNQVNLIELENEE